MYLPSYLPGYLNSTSDLQIMQLFSDEDDVGEGKNISKSLNVNKRYSQQYEQWRTKEELSKLKSKYGKVENSSSDISEEDEVGNELTKEVEQDFFAAYSLLKQKDQRIYDPDYKAFRKPAIISAKPKSDKAAQPLTVKQAEYRQAIAEQSDLSDVEDSEDKPQLSGAYYEELERSKKAFLDAANNVNGNKDEDFLSVNLKENENTFSSDNAEPRSDNYNVGNRDDENQLKGSDGKPMNASSNEIEWLHRYWNDENISKDEKFLRNYILNHKYRVDQSFIEPEELNAEKFDISDDDREIARAEQFEQQYNFRFEELDKEFVKHYPRTIKSSLRKVDTRRKERRTKYKERKLKEITRYTEEIKRIKALKKKQIEQQIARIKEVAGNASVSLLADSMENDFDPNDYDNQMEEMFGDDYYDEKEAKMPVLEDTDECFNVDLTYDVSSLLENGELLNNFATSPLDKGPEEKKYTRRQRKKQRLNARKQQNDDGHQSDPELFFEDVIAGLPCRFKYRQVMENDFGLDADEILNAEDTELNKWVSLRRMVQYRTDEQEKFDKHAYAKRKFDRRKKVSILGSIYGAQKPKVNSHDPEGQNDVKLNDTKKMTDDTEIKMTDERLMAYGLNPKKFKRKHKYANKD